MTSQCPDPARAYDALHEGIGAKRLPLIFGAVTDPTRLVARPIDSAKPAALAIV